MRLIYSSGSGFPCPNRRARISSRILTSSVLLSLLYSIATCRIGTEFYLCTISRCGVFALVLCFGRSFAVEECAKACGDTGRQCGPLAQRAHHGAACRFFHVEKILG